ncbi:para-aminobenzoate synthetase component 1 [Lentzea albidocapillata subsp. violacea]|uniref:Para-aminobenzoate synthetase component 1 n=1 Tax=Lentzea albidocapillata subsp. violacea TaxID=128104 RepID=A0A1G8QFM2_9PSEU|nr:aminodeoxychorismate synthase component I [Lentzea albidocapillata]SDJ03438.1 para-aminobenzoate synthetase component 1 [Lentzea albidocapillata subsp. violacea]
MSSSAERLGAGAPVAAVLRALARRAERDGIAPPAALTGSWFGSRAVVAPSLDVRAVDAGEALRTGSRRSGGFIGGGWFLALRYPDDGLDSLDATGAWSDSVLRMDDQGCWWFESLSGQSCPPDVRRAVRRGDVAQHWEIDWIPPDGDAHRAAVRACLTAIAAGDVYQTCVCTRFTGEFRGSVADLFADGIEATAPERGAFLGGVASFSPELFLSRHGNEVRSSPIKGTLPLSADPALLRRSEKEVAENVMIVDLVRNDLGRVCLPGTVTVPELLQVRPAPGVWHLMSTVSGALPPAVSDLDVVAAVFPPGSVTGAPKSSARRFIRQWEHAPRGAYCGAVGLSSPVAGLELNVAIRTVEVSGSTAVLGVGGGITIDSDPEAEWQECLTKARAVTGLTARAKVPIFVG